MKAKNKLLTLFILSSGAAAGIAAINKGIQLTAVSKNLLSTPQSLCYRWRLGTIHYTKSGSGKPLLLIHSLNAVSSSYEWNRLIKLLQNDYTVYAIDLLGCGLSEKINMTYTAYMYVQLISDFIKTEIGHRTSVISSGEASSIPIMACANNSDLFDQIMLINPLSLSDYSQIPGRAARIYKFILDFPILGTFIYHIACSKHMIRKYLASEGFYNPYSVKQEYVDAFYESAHLGRSPKSLYGSVRCNYTKCCLFHSLRKIDNSIYLIGGGGISHIKDQLKEYQQYNPAIEIALLPHTRQLPQLEDPDGLYHLIKTYIS